VELAQTIRHEAGGHGFAKAEENPWRVDETRRMFDLTRELGGNILTTHIGVVPEDDKNPRRAIMMEAMAKLGDYAKDADCYIAIETGPERPKILRRFLDEIGKERVGVNYDPANLKMVLDEDPVAGVSVLADKIFHTHAKDGKMIQYIGPEAIYGFFAEGGIGDMRMADYFLETPLGEGDVPWDAYLAALYDIGYKGFLTIEREVGDDPEADIRKAVTFLEGKIR
jgi:sugar phosphate isomerase/epimerase